MPGGRRRRGLRGGNRAARSREDASRGDERGGASDRRGPLRYPRSSRRLSGAVRAVGRAVSARRRRGAFAVRQPSGSSMDSEPAGAPGPLRNASGAMTAGASNRPLISVVVTSYNREVYIAEALQSVLAQTMGDFEL